MSFSMDSALHIAMLSSPLVALYVGVWTTLVRRKMYKISKEQEMAIVYVALERHRSNDEKRVLKVKNGGRTLAKNIKLTVKRDFLLHEESNLQLSDLSVIQYPISHLGPSDEIYTTFMFDTKFISPDSHQGIVLVEYEDRFNQIHKQEFVIEFIHFV